jgi:adenosylcobinamide-GDP ribazoletransferase
VTSGLLSAVSFLTILPVPAAVHRDRRGLAAASAWFPAIGWLVGLLSLAAFRLGTFVSPAAGGLCAALVQVLLTRALHLDGLADSCDGLGRAGGPAARRAAMRDPRLGTFGVTAVVLDLGFRAVLATAVPWALPFAAACGRWAMVEALALAPYDRAGRLRGAAGRLSAAGRAFGLACLAPGVALAPPAALAIPAAWILVRTWVPLVRQRLGALSGDTLGALCEIAELTTLALLAVAP